MIRVSGKSYTCRAVFGVDDYGKVCASNDVETRGVNYASRV